MSHMTETLSAVMDAILKNDVDRFLSYVTDDIEYHFHVGSPAVHGKAGFRKFLARYGTMTEGVIWRVLRTAESDDCLFIEGYEEYLDKKSGDRIAHPYMGIMEFRDGKVAKWRDYFEMNNKVKA